MTQQEAEERQRAKKEVERHHAEVREFVLGLKPIEDEIKRLERKLKLERAAFIRKRTRFVEGEVLRIVFPNQSTAELIITGVDFDVSPLDKLELCYSYKYLPSKTIGKVAARRTHRLFESGILLSNIDNLTHYVPCADCGEDIPEAISRGNGFCNHCNSMQP